MGYQLNETLWEVLAPERFLDEAVIAIGLDRNAVVRNYETAAISDEASLSFPSAFCDRPEYFLTVIAIMVRGNVPVTLYQYEIDRYDGHLVQQCRIFPTFDRQMLDLLAQFTPESAQDVGRLSQQADRLIAYLKAAPQLPMDEVAQLQ